MAVLYITSLHYNRYVVSSEGKARRALVMTLF